MAESEIATAFAPYQQRPKPVESTVGEFAGAAFRQNNDLYNLFETANRPIAWPDEDFDPIAFGESRPSWETNSSDLVLARSEAEFLDFEQRIATRQRDMEVLGSRGVGGVLASMGAGLISPTAFIPFVGQARGVKGAAQAFALAALGSGLQELPIAYNQIGDTSDEFLLNVAAGTVLGGLMGSAAVYMRPAARARAEASLRADADLVPDVHVRVDAEGRMDFDEGRPYSPYQPPDDFGFRLPPVPKGHVRFYHGGVEGGAEATSGGGRWVSPDPVYARDYRNADGDAEVWYVDLPKGSPEEVAARGWTPEDEAAGINNVGSYRTFEAGEETAAQMQRAERGRPDEFGSPQSIGAASVEGNNRVGDIVNAGRFDPTNLIAKTSPLTILVQQDAMPRVDLADGTVDALLGGPRMVNQSLRDFSQRLGDSGIMFKGNRQGVATSPGGTAEARKGRYTARLGRTFYALQDNYLAYLKDSGMSPLRARASMAKQAVVGGGPKGRMTYDEFKEAVVDGANQPGAPTNTHVQKAVAAVREYYAFVNEEMLDATDQRGAAALYNIRDETPEEGYFTHRFSPEKVIANRVAFVDIVSNHYLGVMNAFYGRRVGKLQARARAEGDMERYMNLDREAATAEIGRLTQALEDLKGRDVEDPRMIEAYELLDEARYLEDKEVDDEMYDLATDMTDAERADTAATLRARADQLIASVPKKVVEDADEAKRLSAQLKVLRKSFGNYEQKRTALLDRIAKNEEMNLNAMWRIVSKSRAFFRDSATLSDAALDKSLARLEADLEKQIVMVERGRARLEKMKDGNPVRFETEDSRQLLRGMRESRLQAKRDGAAGLDREQARAHVTALMEDTMRRVNALNEVRSRRNAKMLEDAEEYRPEAVRDAISDMKTRRERDTAALDDQLRQAGSGETDVMAGEFDFSGHVRELAEELASKIIGDYTRIGQTDMLPSIRGPLKHRLLNIPYQQKRAFLDLDAERVLATYTQTMSSDIELFRQFGSVDGSTAIERIKTEYQDLRDRIMDDGRLSAEQKRAKIEAMSVVEGRYVEMATALLERFRGLRGLANSRHNLAYRAGRVAMNWNVATMMGSAAISAFSDASRAVTVYGISRSMRSSFTPLIKSLTSVPERELVQSQMRVLRMMGIGIDSFTQARSRGMMDLMQPNPFQTKLERGMEQMSASIPFVALFGAQTDALKLVSGMSSMAHMLDAIEALAEGGAKQEQLEWLASAGIDSRYAERIWGQMAAPSGSSEVRGVRLPNTEKWEDREAARAFEAAMLRESDRIIVSPGLERPLWMDGSIGGRLVGQFRSFTMSSNSKMTVAMAQARGATPVLNAATGFASALALGALSAYFWAITSGEKSIAEMQKWDMAKWADQMLMRSGYLGVLSEAQNIGSSIPLVADYVTFSGAPVAGRRADNLLGAIGGPSVGKAWDVAQFLQGLDEPTRGTMNQARKLIPWQNVFYLKQGFEMLEEGMANLFNLPEKRAS